MVPYFSIKEELENTILKEDVPQEHPSISTYLTYYKDEGLSPSMSCMIRLIREHTKTWY